MRKLSNTPRNIRRRIQRRNEKFLAASVHEQRVMIAQDVIARIRTEQFIPQPGDWVTISTLTNKLKKMEDRIDDAYPGLPTIEAVEKLDKFRTEPLQELIVSGVTCTCCALGGMLASCVAIKNDVTVGDYQNDELDGFLTLGNGKDPAGLRAIFGRHQLSMIEYCFENGTGAVSGSEFETNLRERLDDWNDSVPYDPTDRMISIMENIIENKGTFKP